MAEYTHIGPRYSAGGSPGASRGPGICPSRRTSMAGVIASTAGALCAVKAAASTLWAAFARPAAPWAAPTSAGATVLSAITAWRSTTRPAAVPGVAKSA